MVMPLKEEDLEAAGLWPMQKYAWWPQETIAYYIATQPIFELYTDTERMMGTSKSLGWREKYHRGEEGEIYPA